MARAIVCTLDLPLDDTEVPQRGDIHVTERAVYLILDARLVDSRLWDNRWRLTQRRIGDAVDRIPTPASRPAVAAVSTDGARWWWSRRRPNGVRPGV
jgi:hypothetical protein